MDDSSYSLEFVSLEDLTENLSQVFRELSSYMSSNKSILNNDKMHLIVLMFLISTKIKNHA